MAWARLDDGFDDNPKVMALLDEDDQVSAAAAIGLWTLCLSWAHRNTRQRGRTPGLIPAGLPRRFLGAAGRDAAQLLVKHGLWEQCDDGGWKVHDFTDYLPSEETRAARAEAGRKGAASRWGHTRQAREAFDTTSDAPLEGDHTAAEAEVSPGADGTLPLESHDGVLNAMANDGSRAPARRVPTPTPVPEPEKTPTESSTHTHGSNGNNHSNGSDTSGKRSSTRPPADQPGADFDAFWQVCPRKKAKGQARKAWPKARQKASAETLIEAMGRYAAEVRGREERYIAFPSTWLNQERWLDEPDRHTSDQRERRGRAVSSEDELAGWEDTTSATVA